MSSPLSRGSGRAAARMSGRGTALVADDEPSVLRLAEMMFQQLGFAVLTATDGGEALGLLAARAAEVRIAFLDITMPHMSGPEALAAIRALRPDLPVIVCSGILEESVPPEMLVGGLTRFLAKPFPMRELERLVDALVPRAA